MIVSIFVNPVQFNDKGDLLRYPRDLTTDAALLTEYRGLTVKQLKELRTALGGNATYAVVKNTLTKIAAKDAGVEGLSDMLVGPSAIAFITGDPVETAKGLRDFAKANPSLVVKGGFLDKLCYVPWLTICLDQRSAAGEGKK